MYKKSKDLMGFRLNARDGEIGRIKDFLFDDRYWAIRHVVADTGNWLPKRRVLISPIAVTGILDAEHAVPVDLTKRQIENSPAEEEDKPVSRQMEQRHYAYYGWPTYWTGPYVWGPSVYPRAYGTPLPADVLKDRPKRETGDPHLRSTAEVNGYHIQTLDHEFGHVDDFIFDDEDWVIHYLVVDTRNWWPGKKVLLPPDWLSSIDWSRSQIRVELDRETVKRSPEYQPDMLITREYEEQLYSFYNRQPYWRVEAPRARAA